MKIVALSSMLVIVGVVCKRTWLLITSFYGFNISGAPGVISGSSQARAASGMDAFSLVGTYSPHLDGNNGRSWSDCALRSRIYRPLAKAIRDLLQTSVIEQAGGQKRKTVRLFH